MYIYLDRYITVAPANQKVPFMLYIQRNDRKKKGLEQLERKINYFQNKVEPH